MGRFINGVLVGAGIALLVAPMRGEEMRSLLRERLEELRGSLPDDEQLRQAGQSAASTVQQTAQSATNMARQTAAKARQTGQTGAT